MATLDERVERIHEMIDSIEFVGVPLSGVSDETIWRLGQIRLAAGRIEKRAKEQSERDIIREALDGEYDALGLPAGERE